MDSTIPQDRPDFVAVSVSMHSVRYCFDVKICQARAACMKEFNLIAISYWLFIGDIGSLIGPGP